MERVGEVVLRERRGRFRLVDDTYFSPMVGTDPCVPLPMSLRLSLLFPRKYDLSWRFSQRSGSGVTSGSYDFGKTAGK